MKKTKKQNIIEVKVKAPKIEMDNKRYVVLRSSSELSEEEIRKIIEILEHEKIDIKNMYFSNNTPIMEVQQRGVKDLLKIFIDRSKSMLKKHIYRSTI